MIAIIKGQILDKGPNFAVIMTGGVGFFVYISLSTYVDLPPLGEEVKLYIHTVVKENAIELYGFTSEREREIFKLLLSATGIGTRLALAILSGIDHAELIRAITQGDTVRLKAIPGVGKRLAERIIFELKDRLVKLENTEIFGPKRDDVGGPVSEAVSALVNLGYPEQTAISVVMEAKKEAEGLEDLIRCSLRLLARGRA